MTNCIRCGGAGILALQGDNEKLCPMCDGLGYDVVAEYTSRYKLPLLVKLEIEADKLELERIRNQHWYRMGLYEALGYDRNGVTYASSEDDRATEDDYLEHYLLTGKDKVQS